MLSFSATVIQMSSLFLLVIIGYACNKLKYMDTEFNKRLSALILNVTAPFLILSSVMGDILPKPEDIVPVLSAGVFSYAVLFILSFVISKFLCNDSSVIGSYRFIKVNCELLIYDTGSDTLSQRLGKRRYLQRMCKSGTYEITLIERKYLSLILKPSEGRA